MHVVPAILKAGDDGAPSPYSVRVLTRDPTSRRAQELIRVGVECVQGVFSITVILMPLDAITLQVASTTNGTSQSL